VWDIPTRSLTGISGVTIRDTVPADSTTFLERRFNRYFTDAVAANAFVTAAKASLGSLVNENIGSGLGNESFTAEPT
jgi:hypothetical protein